MSKDDLNGMQVTGGLYNLAVNMWLASAGITRLEFKLRLTMWRCLISLKEKNMHFRDNI